MRTVQTRSGEMAYVDAGQGRVALFVHGVGTSSHLWRNVIEALRDEPERRCVAIDLPLHGATPPRPDYSLPALAEAIEDFCAALDLTGIDLVGNDTGGAIAQVFAARHPERLRTFTLTNCDAHDNMPPEQFKATIELAERGELAPLIAAGDGLDVARASLGAGYERAEALSDETLRVYIDPIRRTPERAREFERFLVSLRADDLLDAEPGLRKLDVPTLVVWGTGDEFFEVSWAHWLHDTIPGGTEVVEVEGAKLFFPDERPADLVPHLLRHWAAH
ncbi:MAG TPA: alpha/beta hydrolase [Streptosporangiaceae bacterium]|nr:alpha/beta hydrolase [Streptosporangiaceae bacterium]